MKKNLLRITLLMAVLIVSATLALSASDYPTGPITIIVPSNPGGSFDLTARTLASVGQEYFGVPLLVKNIPGGGFTIGTEELVNSAPDGYTLHVSSFAPWVYAPQVMEVNYSAKTDAEFITCLVLARQVIAVHKNQPFDTMMELLEYVKENPGEITVAHSSTIHEVWLRALEEEGYIFTPVLFPGGGPATTAAAGGHADVLIGSVAAAIPFHDSGDLKMLMVVPGSEVKLIEGIPDLEDYPYLKEIFGDTVWVVNGVHAPKGVPEERLEFIREAIKKTFDDTAFQTMLDRLGLEPFYMDSELYYSSMLGTLEVVERFYK